MWLSQWMKISLAAVVLGSGTLWAAGMDEWKTPRRGVMISESISAEDLAVLDRWNVNLVRWQLRWGDFPKSPADSASAEEYDAWLEQALAHFDRMLPLLEQYGIKVVLDLHTPPGGRLHPGALCQTFLNTDFQRQFIDVWKRIATRYRGNSTIIAYDLMNEPVIPETPARGVKDWRTLALETIAEIRRIDSKMPIVFENHQWAIPNTLENFEPLPVADVIYSIHFYYPYEVAFQGLNGAPNGIVYPGKINGEYWDRARLAKVLEPVSELQRKHGVPIYIGEFSCIRWAPEATGVSLLGDMISIFEENQWSWTYHAFREWSGWSVEHNSDSNDPNPSPTPTPRQLLLQEAFRKNVKTR